MQNFLSRGTSKTELQMYISVGGEFLSLKSEAKNSTSYKIPDSEAKLNLNNVLFILIMLLQRLIS